MNGIKRPGGLSWKIGLMCFSLVLVAAIIIGISLMIGIPFIVSTLIALLITAVSAYILAGQIVERFDSVRKQAEDMIEKTLKDSANEKNKLETILTHMADGVIVVDLSCNIIHANPPAKTMLKMTDDDIERIKYDDIIRKYDEELILENILYNSEDEAVEDTFLYGGATFLVNYDRFKDEEDNIIGMIIILQDITERLKIENMQTDFVANISHELKTPLTTIKSYTETLLEDGVDDTERTKEFLKIIDSETDRMNRLVKDLLQLSRLNYKQQKWYKREGDLISLVRTAVKKMEMTAGSKDQQLNVLFSWELPIMIDMDKDRIEQVILNVLSNAIKYTKEEGRIDVDIVKKDKTVDVIITDNGIGIPEKQLSRVFERFFRVDKARSRMMGGTGLGLSISKQILEEHKGDIDIESKFGRGTKVTVSLPLAPIRGKRNIE